MVADHSSCPAPSSCACSSVATVDCRSGDGRGGYMRQMRTFPSRPPVATNWYERPHDGAQATEVIA